MGAVLSPFIPHLSPFPSGFVLPSLGSDKSQYPLCKFIQWPSCTGVLPSCIGLFYWIHLVKWPESNMKKKIYLGSNCQPFKLFSLLHSSSICLYCNAQGLVGCSTYLILIGVTLSFNPNVSSPHKVGFTAMQACVNLWIWSQSDLSEKFRRWSSLIDLLWGMVHCNTCL